MRMSPDPHAMRRGWLRHTSVYQCLLYTTLSCMHECTNARTTATTTHKHRQDTLNMCGHTQILTISNSTVVLFK